MRKISLAQCIIYKQQLLWESHGDTLHYFLSYFSIALRKRKNNLL